VSPGDGKSEGFNLISRHSISLSLSLFLFLSLCTVCSIIFQGGPLLTINVNGGMRTIPSCRPINGKQCCLDECILCMLDYPLSPLSDSLIKLSIHAISQALWRPTNCRAPFADVFIIHTPKTKLPWLTGQPTVQLANWLQSLLVWMLQLLCHSQSHSHSHSQAI